MALVTSPFGGDNVQPATNPAQGEFQVCVEDLICLMLRSRVSNCPKSVPASSQSL